MHTDIQNPDAHMERGEGRGWMGMGVDTQRNRDELIFTVDCGENKDFIRIIFHYL